MEVSGQLHDPTALPPGKQPRPPMPPVSEAACSPEPVWRPDSGDEKCVSLILPVIETRSSSP
jgi:hypothetical protein